MPSELVPKLFTPKQVANALGVSESSVKRWCDTGRVRATRTAGGHRKLPVSAVVDFVRETGHEIQNPDALAMVAVSARRKPAQLKQQLFDVLLSGNESACRELLLGLYQQGWSICEIGDELIGPVFNRIGDGWEAGRVTVHEERRSCEVTLAVLHELRRWLTPPPPDAPLALTATPAADFAQVPIRLVELVLQASGWRTVMAGSGLPVKEIRAAIKLRKPQLVCLSLTHVEDLSSYVEEHNREFNEFEVQSAPMIVGGGALAEQIAARLNCTLLARQLADLEQWLGEQSR